MLLMVFYLHQDYKTYLDFVLALENRREPQALQYLFRLLDVQNKGFLNIFDINFFFRVSDKTWCYMKNQDKVNHQFEWPIYVSPFSTS